jgi:phosphoribosylformylglycinamidine cyclo-ligase
MTVRTTGFAYRAAGVDVTRGYRALDMMRAHIARARTPGVVGDVGGFGGLFHIGDGRLLCAGADGVGTKLKLAFLADRHTTVGVDAVAMCVNDVVCCGARPLFFLDYIATGRLDPGQAADIVSGVADGCVAAGCALLGGETAEMPGFYADGEYDLAGFAVGVVDRDKLVDGSGTRVGDVLIGLVSSGPHSNGYSLIRTVFGERRLRDDTALLEALLVPTRVYVRPILAMIDQVPGLRGAAHITGGGFVENVPRMLPAGLSARIDRAALPTPAVFDEIAAAGHVSVDDMFATFNMGVGLVVAVAPGDAEAALAVAHRSGTEAVAIGEVVAGDREVLW